MSEKIALTIGYAAMTAGGILCVGLLLGLTILIVNYCGQTLWDKLRALYDLHTLRAHLRMLEAQGKTLRKANDEARHGE